MAVSNMHSGTVVSLQLDRGYGFIFQQVGEPDIFFHAKDLADDLEFNEQLYERRVEFDIVGTPKGDRATNVRAAK